MKNFDLIKIRKALPHGAITEIAERVGVDSRIISEVLNEGWHKDRQNEVVSCALEILKRSNIDPTVVKAAEDMEFTTDSPGHLRRFVRKKKTSSYKSRIFGGLSWPVVIAVVVGLFLLFGKKKTTV